MNKPWIGPLTVFAVANLFGLAFFFQNYIQYNPQDKPFPWFDVLVYDLTARNLWALFSFLIFRFVRQNRLESRNWKRLLLLHILAGIVFALVHSALHYSAIWTVLKLTNNSFATMQGFLSESSIYMLAWKVLTYFIITIACYGLDYYQRYKEQEFHVSRFEAGLAEAEFQSIKNELNPRFLFQTFASIRSTLAAGKIELADNLVERLGDLLHMTVESSGKEAISLERELEFLRCQFEIEEMRLGKSIPLNVVADSETLDAPVPLHVLQPLLEHVMLKRICMLPHIRFEIRAESTKEKLMVTIRDNLPCKPGQAGEFDGLRRQVLQVYNHLGRELRLNPSSEGLTILLNLTVMPQATQPAPLAQFMREAEPPGGSASVSTLWLRVCGAWTIVGLLFVARDMFSYLSSDEVVPWKDTLQYSMRFYVWALISPAIFSVVRKLYSESSAWIRRLGVLLLMNLFVCLVMILYSLTSNLIFAPTTSDSWRNQILTFRYVSDSLLYWAVVAFSAGYEYHQRYLKERAKAAQLQAQLLQAQLRALKMQLHPHFLFNALNSISELLYQDAEMATEVLCRLEDFLRLTLENTRTQRVKLEKELEFVRFYLRIQQVRFQDRLEVNLKVSAETLPLLVPNLLWQPVVENAIRYAIAPRTDCGKVEFGSTLRDEKLVLYVKDNGPGIPDDGSFQEGFGLSYVRTRLGQLYGTQYTLQYENAPEGGLLVQLEIPASE